MRPPALVALTPGDLEPGREALLLRRVERAWAAGLRGVLLREPHLPDGPLLALARELRQRLAPPAWLGVSDRPHVAVACGADAVHLGFRSLAPGDVPPVLRDSLAVGLSTHAGDAAPDPARVDYAFHGPLRDTPSKAGLVPTVGPDGLAAFCAASAVPVWALGGVRPEDVAAALGAGAAGVAARAGVLGAPDAGAAAAAYLEALERASTGEGAR